MSQRQPRRARGFTLLETLVALVIAATAAAVISAFLRGILARVQKEQEHQVAVLRLLNQTALLRVSALTDARWVYEKELLRLLPARPELPEVVVRNYLPDDAGIPLPPIELAFTPYQRLTVESGRHTLQFLRPALPSPVRRADPATLSVDTGRMRSLGAPAIPEAAAPTAAAATAAPSTTILPGTPSPPASEPAPKPENRAVGE
jgi:prepilin-type N-terminal cleavage/methylation domain-containing protein